MDYPIKGTRIEVTAELSDYLGKKLAGLEKLLVHFGSSVKFWVELECTTRHHRTGSIYRAEFQVQIAKKRLVAEATGENIFEAVDRAKDVLWHELRVYKEKLGEKNQRLGRRWKGRIQDVV